MRGCVVDKEMFIELRRSLPSQLPAFLAKQRWFGGKARQIQGCEINDIVSFGAYFPDALVLMVRVTYVDGGRALYSVPVLCSEPSFAVGNDSVSLTMDGAQNGQELVLVDALRDEQFLGALLHVIGQHSGFTGEVGELSAFQTSAFTSIYSASAASQKATPLVGEQSNSSVIYGDSLILKFFRRVEEGRNPELEIGTFLTEKAHYPNIPQLGGWMEYRVGGKQMTQAILQAFVPNQGDAWRYTLKSLSAFYEAAAKVGEEGVGQLLRQSSSQAEPALREFARQIIGPYLQMAGLLGRRTAELHLALASDATDPDFAPEPFTMEFQRRLETSLLELTSRILNALREKHPSLPAERRDQAKALADREHELARRFQALLRAPIHATRTRIHGDYHLGQVLYTGSDFVIIDFEGEPARPLAERRIKQSPLQDVAGMLRSFRYAAFAPLLGAAGQKPTFSGQNAWAEIWNSWVANRFLKQYFQTSGAASYIPSDPAEVDRLLELHLLEKAIYELGYELNNRPAWVGIPLEGIFTILEH